jgi:hypothetical protein
MSEILASTSSVVARRWSTDRASASWPAATRYRGDSGTNVRDTRKTAAGRSSIQYIHCQASNPNQNISDALPAACARK